MVRAYLWELRKNNGWTLSAAAQKIGISRSFLSLLESGKRNPSQRVVAKIEEVFADMTTVTLNQVYQRGTRGTKTVHYGSNKLYPTEVVSAYKD